MCFREIYLVLINYLETLTESKKSATIVKELNNESKIFINKPYFLLLKYYPILFKQRKSCSKNPLRYDSRIISSHIFILNRQLLPLMPLSE